MKNGLRLGLLLIYAEPSTVPFFSLLFDGKQNNRRIMTMEIQITKLSNLGDNELKEYEEPKEVWKDIYGFEGLYQVSNLGRVRSLVYGRTKILKERYKKDGYVRTAFCINYKISYYTVHRLVAHAFIPNPNNLAEVNHKDGIKTNNHINNLEWVTHKQNMEHASKTGLMTNVGATSKGFDHHSSINVVKVNSITNEDIETYGSSRSAERMTGVNHSSITRCCKGKQYTACGFKWRYADE